MNLMIYWRRKMIKETKTNEIPNGWIETSIEEISERIHYGYTASAESKNTGIRLLNQLSDFVV